MNDSTIKAVYVVTCDTMHTDLYEQDGDGTTILGVFDDRELAEKRLVDEYDTDKIDLLEGSCSPDGNYEITEDELNPTAVNKDGVTFEANAHIAVSFKGTGELDREYSYAIITKTLND